MENPNLPPQPPADAEPENPGVRPRLEGRDAVIAAMGATGFEIEQGPNRHTDETDQTVAEQADERPGFNRRQKYTDGWVVRLLERHDLPDDASLEDIEPVAKELWGNMPRRLDATALVLGRRVDAREARTDPELGMLMMVTDADEAFGGLLIIRAIEQMEAESAGPAQ